MYIYIYISQYEIEIAMKTKVSIHIVPVVLGMMPLNYVAVVNFSTDTT